MVFSSFCFYVVLAENVMGFNEVPVMSGQFKEVNHTGLWTKGVRIE